MVAENGEKAREEDIDLSEDQKGEVDEREAASPIVVHEVIRRAGDEELGRPAGSLLASGLVGGAAISVSILGQGTIEHLLPKAGWAPLVASFGYCLGFLIVILGRLQLFTESTLSAVIPVATHFSPGNLGRLLRLWGLVLGANLAGTLLVAALVDNVLIGSAEGREAMLAVSRKLLEHGWTDTLKLGIPAGFLVAAIPWSLPAAQGQQFWVVVALTYLIALGGFTHVVAGSGEAWLLALSGEASWGRATGGMILPALIGNVIGGTGMFALLAHIQVRQEL
ncbi:formate/nitrite transporter family protein [Sphingomonas aracearum]|uniref:Formate/nitrite transporter family protein n=1 Tax=Sphingomonas aracearum TaxID=2283317 RepID=A0A369VVR4_9SPHN|nr:formate/nitrite transporter family protein [Sphingomonas aracearum]RDE05735.1 formate/nitrite transporter family protein [Sphingomonas aracearum]